MALEYAHGAIQWNAADGVTTQYTVSGLSFQPKALRFVCTGIGSATNAYSNTTDLRRSVGFAVAGPTQRCVAAYDQDAADPMNCGAGWRNDAVVATVDGAGAFTGRLRLASITSGGFVLEVDDTAPANLTVFWEAWGGSDITVAALVDIAEPAATGTQNHTVTGFTSDGAGQVLMLAGCQTTAAANGATATDSGMCAGFATGTASAQNVVAAANSDDASATSDTDRYQTSGECLAMMLIGGGNPSARAALNAWLTDGFQLNWIARATTDRRYIALAIKGGQWRAGSLTIDGTTLGATSTVSGLPFQPVGISFVSDGAEIDTPGTSQAHDVLSFGMATSSTSRRSITGASISATAAADVSQAVEYDQVMVQTNGGVNERVDLDAILSDGFRLINDLVSTRASIGIMYLAFAGAAGQQFTSGPHAAVATGVGALILQARPVLAGTAIGVGTRSLQAQVVRAAAATGIAALAKQVQTILAGTAIGLGTATASRVILVTAEAVASAIAALSTQTRVVRAATATGVAALVKSVQTHLAGTATGVAGLVAQLVSAGAVATLFARVVLRASQALSVVLSLSGATSNQAFQTGTAYQADAFQSGGSDIFRKTTLLGTRRS